jgi:hypothetical protein
MKNRIQTLLIVFLFTGLTACWDAGEIATTTVKGQVTDYYSGEPVKNATLMLVKCEPAFLPSPIQCKNYMKYEADAEGKFSITFIEEENRYYKLVVYQNEDYFFTDYDPGILQEGKENSLDLKVKPIRDMKLKYSPSLHQNPESDTIEYDEIKTKWIVFVEAQHDYRPYDGGELLLNSISISNGRQDTVFTVKAVPGELHTFFGDFYLKGELVKSSYREVFTQEDEQMEEEIYFH